MQLIDGSVIMVQREPQVADIAPSAALVPAPPPPASLLGSLRAKLMGAKRMPGPLTRLEGYGCVNMRICISVCVQVCNSKYNIQSASAHLARP